MRVLFIILFIIFICFSFSVAQKQKHTFPSCTKEPKEWCSGTKECKVWYVDNAKGSDDNDGSKTKPWKSVENVLATKTGKWVVQNWDQKFPIKKTFMKSKNSDKPVKGGDVIVLLAGNYPQITISQTFFTQNRLTITALPNSKVYVDLLRIYSAANIVVSCLNITSISKDSSIDQTLVAISGNSALGPAVNITLDSNTIYSFPDIFKYKTNSSNLNKYAGQGIAINDFGYYNKLVRNYIYNVRRGVILNSPYNYVGYNIVNYVFGDSFRVLHNHSHVEYNTAKNIMNVDNNTDHRDGIQMFTKSNRYSLTNIQINNNRLVADVDERPFPAQFQGITSFDVSISNVRVLNNLISTGHYNGIVLAKSTNCQAIGNTLVDPTQRFSLWISFPSGKGGNIGINNIAERRVNWTGIADEGGNYFGELSAANHAKWFKNPSKHDWKLKNVAGSPFIGKGKITSLDPKLVPGHSTPDIGCYNLED